MLQTTGQYHIFSNIPYAVQPVGDLRFSKPGLPVGNSSAVNNGSVNIICMQASPAWLLASEAKGYNISLSEITEILDNLPGQTEACLVLDVYVPEGIFNNRTTAKGRKPNSYIFNQPRTRAPADTKYSSRCRVVSRRRLHVREQNSR